MSGHSIVHVEIPAGDPAAAGQFYKDVFGWQVNMDESEYLLFQAEGGPGGAFVHTGTSPDAHVVYVPGQVLMFLNADDIDSTLVGIEAHGGKIILPRTEISGGHGWWAVFTDPAGNRMALYTPPRS